MIGVTAMDKTEPQKGSGVNIQESYLRVMADMMSSGNSDGAVYLENIRMKAFDELRTQGHNIRMILNGKKGLISSHLPLSDPAERVEAYCMIGRLLTEDVDLTKESSRIYYSDRVPNCIMIALVAMLSDNEAALGAGRKAHTFRVITDGNDGRYGEFVELIDKLPIVFNQFEPKAVCEQGDIPIGTLFQDQKEKYIDLRNTENLEFLFFVSEVFVITTGRIIFKSKNVFGNARAKDILTLTDSKGRVLAEGCPILPLSEAQHAEINDPENGVAGIIVGVHLERGTYDGLVLLKQKDVHSTQNETTPDKPGFNHPSCEAFKSGEPLETEQAVVDAYKTVAAEKSSPTLEQYKASAEHGKRRIRGKRLVFLILAIVCGFATFAGLIRLLTEPTLGLFIVIFYGLPFALFLWLFLRNGKAKPPKDENAPVAPFSATGSASIQLEPQLEPSKHGKECCLFAGRTFAEQALGLSFTVIEDLGGGDGEGYSWSDGSKKLCQCMKCGALFLSYKIRFLSMSMGHDYDEVNYCYYLPVGSRDEALELVDKYIGAIGLSEQYKGKKIWFDGNMWNFINSI